MNIARAIVIFFVETPEILYIQCTHSFIIVVASKHNCGINPCKYKNESKAYIYIQYISHRAVIIRAIYKVITITQAASLAIVNVAGAISIIKYFIVKFTSLFCEFITAVYIAHLAISLCIYVYNIMLYIHIDLTSVLYAYMPSYIGGKQRYEPI